MCLRAACVRVRVPVHVRARVCRISQHGLVSEGTSIACAVLLNQPTHASNQHCTSVSCCLLCVCVFFFFSFVACSDSLVEVLRAMLAMHLYPRRDEDEDEEEERRGSQSQGGDGIEGVPRVLTTDQVCVICVCVLCVE